MHCVRSRYGLTPIGREDADSKHGFVHSILRASLGSMEAARLAGKTAARAAVGAERAYSVTLSEIGDGCSRLNIDRVCGGYSESLVRAESRRAVSWG